VSSEIIEEVSEDEMTGPTPNDDNVEPGENDSIDVEDQNESSEDNDAEQLQPIVRRAPGHWNDYVVVREAEEEQELHNFVAYNNCGDPNTFDDAVKSEVWRKAMDWILSQ
jgi:hypothetical protein